MQQNEMSPKKGERIKFLGKSCEKVHEHLCMHVNKIMVY